MDDYIPKFMAQWLRNSSLEKEMAAQMISLPVFHVQSSGMKSDSTLSDIFPLHVSATVNKKLGSDFTGETKEISDYGCPNLPQMF